MPVSPITYNKRQPGIRLAGLLISLSVFLLACGGGGGGSSNPITALNTTPVFSLEGSISIAAGSLVDSDINNPSSQNISNNSPVEAQALPSFAVVGGYVNEALNGPAGPLLESGDPADYFSIYLYEGQSIVLDIYDATEADLDLYLLNESGGTILDSSLSTTASEFLLAPYSGNFLLMVEAFSGASNYTLRTDQTASISATGYRLSDAFAANELIVKYREPELYQQQMNNPRSSLRRMGFNALAGNADRPLRLGMGRRVLMQRRAAQDNDLAQALSRSERFSFISQQAREKYETLLAIKTFRADPDVQYAEPNLLLSASTLPNDPRYTEQWNFPFIGLPAAWDLNTGSSSIIVAVIDTGALSAHPDLAANLLAGYDFISDIDNALDGDGLDPNPEDVGSSYHGSHVAGIIAAVSNNARGVSGIAWNTRIMPLRVLGENGGNLYDASQAIRYAAGLSNDSGQLPDRPADIINLSVGGSGYCTTSYRELLAEVRQLGIPVVTAAGNDNSSKGNFTPANCNDVINVGSVGQDRERAPYSNYGNAIDVVAPGGRDDQDQDANGLVDGILSLSATTVSGGALSYGYAYRAGTSMAVPHVSGVFALMLAVNPDLTADDIEQMLISGLLTDDLGPAGKDSQFGYGLINADKAVSAAVDSLSGSAMLTSVLDASISSFEFTPAMSQTEFETRSIGDEAVNINSIAYSSDWLDLVSLGQSGGVESWRLSVNRGGLSAGLYSDTISFMTDANTVNISVILQVNPSDQVYEMGPLNIRLIEEQKAMVRSSATLSSLNNAYRFGFGNLEEGNYRLRISSDLNGLGSNDGGEAYLETDAFLLNADTTLETLTLEWDSPLIANP